jgi:hypothetical protein
MKKFRNLPQKRKVFLTVLSVFLSVPLGAVIGGFLGLVSVTFIPVCCNDAGCHNCFEFNGMIGYEATAFLGFWAGAIIGPILCVIFLIYKYK